MLAAVVGPGNAKVTVAAELDFDATSSVSETYTAPTTIVPNQALAVNEVTKTETYNGDGTGSFVCTQFVVRRVIFSGNNTTANQFTDNCAGAGMKKIDGGRKVRLVA